MKQFRHVAPELRIFQGEDCLALLPRELERVGSRRAVIFCGASLARTGHPLELVTAALGDRCAGVHAGVRAHSPLAAVEDAARELKRLRADAVIAIGGGSAIVTARAASIVLAEGRSPRELCTARDAAGVLRSPKLDAGKLPQFVVPTTPTTATPKAGSAVLDPVDGRRLALFDPKTRARAVFVHPALLETAPRQLVVSAALNTLTMAAEGLMSRSGDPFSDALLMHAVRLLSQHLPQAASGDDVALRAELMLAALMCGHATDYTGAGIALPLGHAISARFHVANGLANAIVLPQVVDFNAAAAHAGLERLADALGRGGEAEPPAQRVNVALDALCTKAGIARRLRDIGVTRESLPELAAVSIQDWFIRDNPRPVQGAGELEQVLQAAW